MPWKTPRRRPLTRPARSRAWKLEPLEGRLAPSASPIFFSLDPARSSLTFTGNTSSLPISPQGPGSFTTTYGGTLRLLYDPAAATLQFTGPTDAGLGLLRANNGGTYAPGVNGGAVPAPGNYGGHIDLGFLGSIDVAVRDFQGAFSTASDLTLSGSPGSYHFGSNQTFDILGTSGLDYRANGLVAQQYGSGRVSLAGHSATNAAATAGTFSDLGNGAYSLSLPIEMDISFTFNGQDVTLHASGSLAATAAVPAVDLNGPGAGNDSTLSYLPGAPPAQFAPSATVTLASGNLTSATIHLTNHPDGNAEALDVNVAGTAVTKSYDAATATLTLSGSASAAVYQSLLRQVTYGNTAVLDASTRLITVTVSDGVNTSDPHTAAVTIPQAITDLRLSNDSVVEFRPAGTTVGTFTAVEAGQHTFTYTLTSDPGPPPTEFRIVGNQLVTTAALDLNTNSSFSILVRVSDEAGRSFLTGFTIAVGDDPALTRVGRTLLVQGGDGADSFVFTYGDVRHAMTLNGVALAVERSSVDAVSFEGGAGADSATVTGTPAAETILLFPDHGSLAGPTYVVSATGVETFVVRAGAEDVAHFHDSPGADAFVSSPGDNACWLLGPNSSFFEMVTGCHQTFAYSTGGADTAHLYDTPATDTFVGKRGDSFLTGGGYLEEVFGFRTVEAISNKGGADAAHLYDTPGNELFEGRANYSAIWGSDYVVKVNTFRTSNGYATAGNDVARLYASTGTNRFNGTRTTATLVGPTYNLWTDHFRQVFVYSGGGRNYKTVISPAFLLRFDGVWI